MWAGHPHPILKVKFYLVDKIKGKHILSIHKGVACEYSIFLLYRLLIMIISKYFALVITDEMLKMTEQTEINNSSFLFAIIVPQIKRRMV